MGRAERGDISNLEAKLPGACFPAGNKRIMPWSSEITLLGFFISFNHKLIKRHMTKTTKQVADKTVKLVQHH